MSSDIQLLEFYSTQDLMLDKNLPLHKFHQASNIYYTLPTHVSIKRDSGGGSLTFNSSGKTIEPKYIKTYTHEHSDHNGNYYFKIRPYNHDILVKCRDGKMYAREGDDMVQFLPYQQDFRASAIKTASLTGVTNVKYVSLNGNNYVITTTAGSAGDTVVYLTLFDAQGRDINTPIEFSPDFYMVGSCSSTLQSRQGIITSFSSDSIHVFERSGKIGIMRLCTHKTAGQGIILDFLVPHNTNNMTQLCPIVQRRFCNSMDPFQPNDDQDFTAFKNKNNAMFYKPGVFIPLTPSMNIATFTVLHNPGVLNATTDLYIFYSTSTGIHSRRACLTHLDNVELYAGRIPTAVTADSCLEILPAPFENGVLSHFNIIPFQPTPLNDNTVHTSTSKQCHSVISALWADPVTTKTFMSCTVTSTSLKTGDLIYPTETGQVIDCVEIETVHVPFNEKTILLNVSEYCVQYKTEARFAEVKTTTSGNLVCGLKGNVGTDMYSYSINIKYDRPKIQSKTDMLNPVLIEATDLYSKFAGHTLRIADIDTVDPALFGSKKTLKLNIYSPDSKLVLSKPIAYTYALNGIENDKTKYKVVENDLLAQINDTGLFEVLYDNDKYDHTTSAASHFLIDLLKEASITDLVLDTLPSNLGLCIDLTPYLGHGNYYGNTVYPQTVCTNNRSVEITRENRAEPVKDSVMLECWARNDPEMFLYGNKYSSGNIKPAPTNIILPNMILKNEMLENGYTVSNTQYYMNMSGMETGFNDAVGNACTTGTIAVMAGPGELEQSSDILPCNHGPPLHNIAPSQFNTSLIQSPPQISMYTTTTDEITTAMNSPGVTDDCVALIHDVCLNKLVVVPGTMLSGTVMAQINSGSFQYGTVIYQQTISISDVKYQVTDFTTEMKKMLDAAPEILDGGYISYSLVGGSGDITTTAYNSEFQFIAIRWDREKADSELKTCFTDTTTEYAKLTLENRSAFYTVRDLDTPDISDCPHSKVLCIHLKDDPADYSDSAIGFFEAYSKCFTVFTRNIFSDLTYGFNNDAAAALSMFRITLDRCLLSSIVLQEDDIPNADHANWRDGGEEPVPYSAESRVDFGDGIYELANEGSVVGGFGCAENMLYILEDVEKDAYMATSLTMYHTKDSAETTLRGGRNKIWFFKDRTSWDIVNVMNAVFKYKHTQCACAHEMEGIYTSNDMATLTLYFFPYFDTETRIQKCIPENTIVKAEISSWTNSDISGETTYIPSSSSDGSGYNDIYLKHHYNTKNGLYTIKDVTIKSDNTLNMIGSYPNTVGLTDDEIIQNVMTDVSQCEKIIVNVQSEFIYIYEVSTSYTNFSNDIELVAGCKLIFVYPQQLAKSYFVNTYTGYPHPPGIDIQSIGTPSNGNKFALCNTANIQSFQSLYIPELTSIPNHTFIVLEDDDDEATQFLIITGDDGTKYKLDHCTSEGSSDVLCDYNCISKNMASVGNIYEPNKYQLSLSFATQTIQGHPEKTFVYTHVGFDFNTAGADQTCLIISISCDDPEFHYNDSNISSYILSNKYVAGCYIESTGQWHFSSSPSILNHLCYTLDSRVYCNYASQSSMPSSISIHNATLENVYSGYTTTTTSDDPEETVAHCIAKGFSGFETGEGGRVTYYTKESISLSDNRGALQENPGSVLYLINDIDGLLYLHDDYGNNKLAIKNSFDRLTETKIIHFDIGDYTLSMTQADAARLNCSVLEKCLSPTTSIQDFYAEWIHLVTGVRQKYAWIVDTQQSRYNKDKKTLQISASSRPFKNDGLSFQLTFFIPEMSGDKLPLLEIDNVIRVMWSVNAEKNKINLLVYYYSCDGSGSGGQWIAMNRWEDTLNNKIFQFNHYYTLAFRTKHQISSGAVNLAKPGSSIGSSGMLEKDTLLPEINLDTLYETAPVDITGMAGVQLDTSDPNGAVYAGPVTGSGSGAFQKSRRKSYRDISAGGASKTKLLVDMVVYDTAEFLMKYNNDSDEDTRLVAIKDLVIHESECKAETAIRWDGNYNHLNLFECNNGVAWVNLFKVGMTRFVLFDGSEPLKTIAQCMSSKRTSANIALLFDVFEADSSNKTMDSLNPANILTCNNGLSKLGKVPDTLPPSLIDDLVMSVNGDVLDLTNVFSTAHSHPVHKNNKLMPGGRITIGKSMTMRVGTFNVYDSIVNNGILKANRLVRKQCDADIDPNLVYSFKNTVKVSATTRAVENRVRGDGCVLITNGSNDEHDTCSSRNNMYISDMNIRGNVSDVNSTNFKMFPPLFSDYSPTSGLEGPIIGKKVMSYYQTPEFDTLEEALVEINTRLCNGDTAVTGVSGPVDGNGGKYHILKSYKQYPTEDTTRAIWLLDSGTVPVNQKTLYNLPDISPVHWTSPNTVANTHFMLHSTEKPVYQYATDPSCPVEYAYNFIPHSNDNTIYDVVLYDMYVNNNTLHVSHGETVDYCSKMFLGNLQSNLTIEGFIEGAPPVPKSNMLSDGGDRNTDFIDYTNTTQISVALSKSISRAQHTSGNSSDDFAMDASFELGGGTKVATMLAPLGFGASVDMAKVDIAGGLGGYYGKTWARNFGDKTLNNIYDAADMCTTGLNGYWPSKRSYPQSEVDKYGEYQFQPTNVGHLFVKSTTMDLYLLRSISNGTILGKTKEPTPDSQEDINIIPFKISPEYIQQGSLDGVIGYDILKNEVVKQDNAKTSYKKLAECYKEMSRIDAELLASVGLNETSAGTNRSGKSTNNPAENAIPKIDETNMESTDYKELPSTMFKNAGAGIGDNGLAPENVIETVLNAPSGTGSDAYVEYVWSNHGGMRMKNVGGTCTTAQTESSSENWMAAGQASFGFTVFAAAIHGGASINMGYVHNESASRDTETTGGKFATLSLTNTLPGNTAIWKLNTDEFCSQGDTKFKEACDNNNGVSQNKYYDDESRVVYNNTTNESVNRIGTVNQYRGVSVFNNSNVNNASVLFDEVVDKEWMQNVVAADEFHPARALLEAESQKMSMTPWRVKHYITYVEREQPETQSPDTSSNGTKYLLTVCTPVIRVNLEMLLANSTIDHVYENVNIAADAKTVLLESRQVHDDCKKVCVYDAATEKFIVYSLETELSSARQVAEENIDIDCTDQVYLVYSTEYIEITPTLSELSYYNNYADLSQTIRGNVFPMSCLETTLKKFSKDANNFATKKEKSKNWSKLRKDIAGDVSKKRIISMLNNMLMETAGMQHRLVLGQ